MKNLKCLSFIFAISLTFLSCSKDEVGDGGFLDGSSTSDVDNSGSIGGRDYVDLGLPSGTLWATCNVGATKPEEYGYYFAWGETSPKSDYYLITYKWYYGSAVSFGKYGTVDNKDLLDPSDDAATANWGSAWRMPTEVEMEELDEKCDWTWKTLNGVNGQMVEGPNGNSIFLPAAGYHTDGLLFHRAGGCGFYWSSSRNPDPNVSSNACNLNFDSSSHNWNNWSCRFRGESVRPVRASAQN